MNLKNIYPLIILLDAFENAALTVISGLSYLLSLALCVLKNFTYLSTRNLGYKAFTSVNTAHGFMPDPSSFIYLKRQNSQDGNRNLHPQSENNWTKSRAQYFQQSIGDGTLMKTSLAVNAKPDPLNMAAEYERKNMVPGTYGRWCEFCQDYKIFARLERIGNSAYTAQYIPHCISCGAVLSPVKPDSGF